MWDKMNADSQEGEWDEDINVPQALRPKPGDRGGGARMYMVSAGGGLSQRGDIFACTG
jgi:hypothetical protein